MHTTQPQLQRVSQWNWSFACKEAVLPACFFLGSSLVAQFHKASVKFLRTTSLACIRLNRNYNESVKWNGSFACKEAVLPACFVFPRASACLISRWDVSNFLWLNALSLLLVLTYSKMADVMAHSQMVSAQMTRVLDISIQSSRLRFDELVSDSLKRHYSR